MYGPMHHFGRIGYPGGLIMIMVVWFLLAALLAALIVWLVRRSRPRESGNSALEVLKVRYARGEINKQEFEEKRKDLT